MTEWDYTIYCDGGKKPNQDAYCRYLIQYMDVPLDPVHVDLPEAKTNNQAEYYALIKALEELVSMLKHSKDEDLPKRCSVQVFTDSMLMANQVNGSWKINDIELFRLCAETRSLLAEFAKCSIVQIDRSQIQHILGC